jgi:hypothetical protein
VRTIHRTNASVSSKTNQLEISEPVVLGNEGHIRAHLGNLKASDMFPLLNRLADLHTDRIVRLRVQVTPKVSIESGFGTARKLKSEAFFMQSVLPMDTGTRLFSKIDSASIEFQPSADCTAIPEDGGMTLRIEKDGSKHVSVLIVQQMKVSVSDGTLKGILRNEADLVARTATEMREMRRIHVMRFSEI